MKATDVTGRSITDKTTVHVDGSKPIIWNTGLVHNGHEQLAVHRVRDLSIMKIHFKAWDKQSGLEQVLWRIGTTHDGNEVGSGSVSVQVISKVICNM